MDEQENDFEIEVSPLSHRARRGMPAGWSPRRARGLRAVFAAGLVALVVLLLLASESGQQEFATLRALFSPAPTATLPSDDTIFNVVHWAPWGKLLANGHPIAQLSLPRNPTKPPVPASYVTTFSLARGHYTLEYIADPFPALRCHISVPAAKSDDCPLVVRGTVPGIKTGIAPRARILDLHAAPEYLPAAAYRLLEDAIRQMLATSYIQEVTLQPGERYVDGQWQVVSAQERLRATASFTLISSPGGDPAPARGCTNICAAPLANSDYLHVGENVVYNWMGATAEVQMFYRYATTDGRIILDHAPVSEHISPSFTVPIALAWNHGMWHAAPQALDLRVDLCTLALDVLNFGMPADSPEFAQLYQARSLPGWTDGCVLLVYTSTTGVDGAVPLLYRFGVLLAASPAAHNRFPALPQVNAYERQLVSQLSIG